MAKFTYETPELRIALTEDDIKASNLQDSSADFGDTGIPGFEVEEEE